MRTQKESHESGSTKLTKSGLYLAIERLAKRMTVANRSKSTIQNYVRAVKWLYQFHGISPKNLDIDQVIDFLNYLQIEKERNWRTIILTVYRFTKI